MLGTKFIPTRFLKKVRQHLKATQIARLFDSPLVRHFATATSTFPFTEMTGRINFDTLDEVRIDTAPPRLENLRWKN